jgi:hypothetical protein
MPCFFCIAVFLIASSVVTAATVDQLGERLEAATSEPVERTADTESVTVWNATFQVGRHAAPVTITVYKDWGRVRIQVLTHVLTRDQVEALQNRVAELLSLRIIDRSDEQGEELVHQAQVAEVQVQADEASPTEQQPAEREVARQVPAPPPPKG